MNNVKNLLMGSLLVAGTSMSAQAGFFDDLKKNVTDSAKQATADTVNKTVNQATDGAIRGVVGGATGGSVSAGTSHHNLSGGPAANLKALTKCHGASMTNVQVGQYGSYYFQSGMSREERSGFINRRPGSVTDGCILPSLQPKEVVYFEVDESVKRQFSNAVMQCVRSANPSAGTLQEAKDNYAYHTGFLTGKDVHLHCGNDQNITDCGTGKNSARGGQYKKKLRAKGKAMLSVQATSSLNAPAGGEKLYCQYFNAKTGTSLFAFEYIRARKP